MIVVSAMIAMATLTNRPHALAQSQNCETASLAYKLPDVNRPRYSVDASFDPDTATVQGNVSIEFRPEISISQFVLRLVPNGGVRTAASPIIQVSKLSIGINDGPMNSAAMRAPDSTTRTANIVARPGDLVRATMNFSTKVSGERNDRISVTRNANDLVAARFGSFIPVLAWEPRVGWNRTPPTTSGAESSMTATADWDVHISIPTGNGFSILASGEEVEPGHWVSHNQRDWAMSIGRFQLSTQNVDLGPDRSAVRVVVGVAAPLTEKPSAYRTRVVSALKLLSNRYGDYPWPTYTLAITPGLKGGIEFPSHVMQGPNSSGRTTPHEVAHQWFYGIIGNDQGVNPWIDEGLATWAEAQVEGTLATFVAKPIPADAKRSAGKPMTYWDRHGSSYYRGVYVQTAQALAALGDPERVDCALRILAATHTYDVVHPVDVFDSLRQQFPAVDESLRPFGLSP